MQGFSSLLSNIDTWINATIAVIIFYLTYRFKVADKKTEDQKIEITKEQEKQWERIDANTKSIKDIRERQSYEEGVRAGQSGSG